MYNKLLLLSNALILFFSSVAGVYFYIRYARAHGLLDIPNARSSHHLPTPRGGGLVFILVWLLGMLAAGWQGLITEKWLWWCLPSTFSAALLGYLEDAKGLSIRQRLAWQYVIALIFIQALGGIASLHLSADMALLLGRIGLAISAIMIIWSINLFNFMDGLDGLAAVESFFVLGIGGFLCWQAGGFELALLAWGMVVVVAGFLLWNWPRAAVFMGDVGSYCLGFLIAACALLGDLHYQIPITLWVILYGVFWFDATVTLLRRMLLRKDWALAHREHAIHRLNDKGWSHQQVLWAVICLNTILAALTLVAYYYPSTLWFCFATAVVILAIAYLWVERVNPLTAESKPKLLGSAASLSRILLILYDILAIPVAWFAAFWLRFDFGNIPHEVWDIALSFFPSALLLQAGAYWIVGLYRGEWQFAARPVLIRILKAVLVGCGLILITLFVATHFQGFPRSVLPIYGVLLFILLGSLRLLLRGFKRYFSKNLPPTTDPNLNKTGADFLQAIPLEDLLQQEAVRLPWSAIQSSVSEKTILITGAEQALSSVVCQEVAKLNPKHLIVIQRFESDLFRFERELKQVFPSLKIDSHLLNVCDQVAMRQILAKYRPEGVFHTLMGCSVPTAGKGSAEMILNNLLGTRTLATLALAHQVEKFLLVSSEEILDTTNIIGATRKVAEIICRYYSEQGSLSLQFLHMQLDGMLNSSSSLVLERIAPAVTVFPSLEGFVTALEALEEAVVCGDEKNLRVLLQQWVPELKIKQHTTLEIDLRLAEPTV